MKGKLIILSISAIIMGMILIVSYALFETFRLDKITVSGNKEFMYNELIELSGINLGENIFMIDLDSVKAGIEVEPQIEVISIERNIPDEIVLNVRERSALALLKFSSWYLSIDIDGVVIDIIESEVPVGYINVSGVATRGFVLGDKVLLEDKIQSESLVRLLHSFDDAGVSNLIMELDIFEIEEVRMVLRNGLRVNIGHPSNLERKLRWLNSDLVTNYIAGEIPTLLDLSVPEQAVLRSLMN